MFSNALSALDNFYHHHGWMMQIFIIISFTSFLHFSLSFVLRRLIAKAARTPNFVDDSFFHAVRLPCICLIWLFGLCFAAEVASSVKESPMLFSYLPYVRKVGALIFSTWFLIRFIKTLEDNYLARAKKRHKKVDKTLVHAVSQLVTISIMITVILIGMQVFGVPISGLLAFGGIGGAGVAFASKDLLANFFGGIILYLDRPFKVGDLIRSSDRKIEGTVELIDWRLTRLRTLEKRSLYVPNGIFLTIPVENASRMTNRCIKTHIGVRYDDAQKIRQITLAIKTMLTEHEEIDKELPIVVNFTEFAASSLNILVHTFTKTIDRVQFQEIQQDVFLKIIEIIDAHEAQCAFPTATVYTPDLAGSIQSLN